MRRPGFLITGLIAGLTLAVSTISCAQEETAEEESEITLNPRLKVQTTLGDFVLELDGEKAPISTLNFIRYAEDGFYNGTVFHRVIPNFMIQGGGFNAAMDQKTDGLRAPIKNEWRNGLKNDRGTIAMARTGEPDSATAQFFINVVDNASLDRASGGAAYAVFGKVVEGMETVEKIRNTKVFQHPKYPQGAVTPVEPVVIQTITLLNEFDREGIEAQVKSVQTAKERELQDLIAKIETETKKKFTKTSSGLMILTLKEGEGASPKSTDRIEVHYTGWLIDGKKFDSSRDGGQPLTIGLNQVISGWTEGVGLMKVGGTAKLIIPPELGYGSQGSPGAIPPNAYLHFEIELLSIK